MLAQKIWVYCSGVVKVIDGDTLKMLVAVRGETGVGLIMATNAQPGTDDRQKPWR